MPVDSNLDKHRVMQAIRRGWVRQEQVEECLLELNTADSILGELQRRGWLNISRSASFAELAAHESRCQKPRSPPRPPAVPARATLTPTTWTRCWRKAIS